MQSDARALEFLAFYDYEVDHANFALYNDLACGKGKGAQLLRLLVATCQSSRYSLRRAALH